MRVIRFASTIAMCVATIALTANIADAARGRLNLRRAFQADVPHATGGMTASMTRLYTGTDTGTLEERALDGSLLNVRNTYTTSLGTATFSNETNRLSGFTVMQADVANDVFYFCSEDDDAIYRYNTVDDSMTRLAGNGVAGMTAGTGINARIDCGTSVSGFARNDQRDRIYVFSGQAGSSNYGLMVLTAQQSTGADAGILAFLAGSGSNAHADGQGASAGFADVHQAFYYYDTNGNKEYLMLAGSDSLGVIRYVDLSNTQVYTAPVAHGGNHVAGTNANAQMPFPTGLIGVRQRNVAFGCTGSRAFTLRWAPSMSEFTVQYFDANINGKFGAAITPDGNHVFFGNGIQGLGTVSRFDVNTDTISMTVNLTTTTTTTTEAPTTTTTEAASTTTAAATTTVAPPPATTTAGSSPNGPNAPNGPNSGPNGSPNGPAGAPADPISLTTVAVEGVAGDGSVSAAAPAGLHLVGLSAFAAAVAAAALA